jgi:hypothetical protein
MIQPEVRSNGTTENRNEIGLPEPRAERHEPAEREQRKVASKKRE